MPRLTEGQLAQIRHRWEVAWALQEKENISMRSLENLLGHARTDVPSLVAEVDLLRYRLADCQRQLEYDAKDFATLAKWNSQSDSTVSMARDCRDKILALLRSQEVTGHKRAKA
jgi:hypothetical protein